MVKTFIKKIDRCKACPGSGPDMNATRLECKLKGARFICWDGDEERTSIPGWCPLSDYTKQPLLLPDWMIYQSFRYCLGRMTYAVSDWCEWAVANWDNIPDQSKGIIIRELEEAFTQDDRDHKRFGESSNKYHMFRLGHDCDRAKWELVRAMYRKEESNAT